MHITRSLRGGLQQRLSPKAQALFQQYGVWFIQFPKFTYIRVQGCPSPPYMLPCYPTDIIVLLEVVRQLVAYVKAYRHKHRTSVSFPITLGDSIEACPSLQAVEDAEKELAFYSIHSSHSLLEITLIHMTM